MAQGRAGRGIRIAMVAVASVAVVLAGAAALGVLALTNPAIATPVTRWAIGAATGRETALERAQLRLAWPLGYELRGLEVAGEIAPTRMGAVDLRVNPLGVLPGVRALPRAQTSSGSLSVQVGGGEGGGSPPGWLAEIGVVSAEDIELAIAREGEAPDTLVIDSAEGDISTGDLELVARGGGATVFFNGGLTRPFGRGVAGALTLRGDNLATLADLAGLAAPDTPPYELNAALSSGPDVWRLNGLTGTIGDSDMAGDVSVRLSGERPFIDAALVSQSLDFDDLGLIVGAPTEIEGEEANDLQRQTNAEYAQSGRFIPDADLDLSRVRAVDAEVDFRADSVRAGGFPMEAVEMHMTLEDGVMRFDPLALTAAQGALRSTVEIDASGEAVLTQAAGEVDGVQLGEMAGGAIGRGELEGRFDLAMTGGNLRAAAASADGSAALWLRDGAIRHLAEEGADLDIGEALLLLISEEPDDPVLSELRCGVVRFGVADGVARADPVVFDSPDSTLAVSGAVDFNDETLDLQIEADNKDFSWGQLFGDVSVGGTLRNPQIAPELGEAVVQGGLAAILGAVAAPLAALPFINPDEGEDAPCAALLARAQGAPGPEG